MNEALTKKQQFWQAQIEACDRSKLSIADYAKANNLKAQLLYQWRSVLKNRSITVPTTEAQFTRVVSSKPLPSHRLTVQLSEAQLQFDDLPDPVWLSTLISSVAVRP